MIEQFYLYSPQYDRDIQIHLSRPEEFDEDKRYPALYMFDGQNLFLDDQATYGQSWHLEDALNDKGYPLFIIGIECSHHGYDRLSEYSPFPFYDEEFHSGFDPQGQKTMDFICDTLIPEMENRYPLSSSRKKRFIGGSSCGGLMSLYGAYKYSDVFSKAVCLSPYLVPVLSELEYDLWSTKILRPTSVFFSWGDHEGENAHEFILETKAITSVCNQLINKRVKVVFDVNVGGTHSEYQWGSQAGLFLDFLFEK